MTKLIDIIFHNLNAILIHQMSLIDMFHKYNVIEDLSIHFFQGVFIF